ncbi:MAG: hypothetical protein GQF41_3903 [Candidatus Rifleibacterium amylolyticum]|nr:MAG: hypothetical protein GQF41_3903 [Candidatus Rifleibacterium amylolyticum]
MKKILIPVMLGLLCAPVSADQNLHEFVRELGYKGDFIMENLPKDSGPRRRVTVAPKVYHVEPQRQLMQPDDLLHPRIMQKSESPRMIPVLMRYHRQNPASPKITRKLAVTCMRNGQPREALYWYTQTWQRDRADYESLWNMACISYRLGDDGLTRKYLTEYAKVDPNSAWGRMAREFLAGRFSGSDLAEGFDSGIAQTGITSGGVAKSDPRSRQTGSEKPSSGSGIMVIEGQRTSFDEFMSGYEEIDAAPPAKINDTAKGKEKVRSRAKAEANTNKASLQKAAIVETPAAKAGANSTPALTEAAPLTENQAVTATAPPLVP